MMNKMKSKRQHLLKFFLLLPLIAVLLFAFRSNNAAKQKAKNTAAEKASLQELQKYEYGLTKPSETPSANDDRSARKGNINKWTILTDTVPEKLNEKGYYIHIVDARGNCVVVVRDGNKKEVEKLLLTKWNEKREYYENKYGEIDPPPPPPAPPAPPVPPVPSSSPSPDARPSQVAPPVPVPEHSADAMPVPPTPAKASKLPENVRHIRVQNNKAVITLKNGEKEEYDLNDPKDKAAFDKKYPTVDPPPPPAPSGRSKPVKVNAVTQASPATDISVNVDEPRKIKTAVQTNTNVNTSTNVNTNTNVNANHNVNISSNIVNVKPIIYTTPAKIYTTPANRIYNDPQITIR